MRGIVVDLAEQAVPHADEACYELLLGHETLRPHVPERQGLVIGEVAPRRARRNRSKQRERGCDLQEQRAPRRARRSHTFGSAAIRMLQRTRSISMVSTEPRHQRIANDFAREW